MESLFTIVATNAVTAAALAALAAVISRFTRRPTLWFALWFVVLLRLLAPPLLDLPVSFPALWSAAENGSATTVAVTGGEVSLDNLDRSLGPVTVLTMVWIAGALVVIGIATVQTFHLRRFLVAGHPARTDIERRAETLANRLGLRRSPPTVEVGERVPPMLWSFLGSVRLILPTALLDRLDDRSTDTLLAHELAHLARRDHWVRHVELAALAVFWWNPVAWWAVRRLRRAQELCCDDRVADLLPDHRRAYADTLVETARFLSGRRLPLGSPARAMADLTQLKGRIRMIMTDRRPRQLALPVRLLTGAVLVAVVAVTPMLTAGTDEPEYSGEPVSILLEEADLNDVLTTFSKLTDREILIEPGVEGTVTIKIDEEPWDRALATIVESLGLTLEQSENSIIIRQRGDGRRSAQIAPVDDAVSGQISPADAVYTFIEGGSVTEPKASEKVPPKYPEEMRKQGAGGSVVAQLLIDATGAVREVSIVESPAEAFSAAATEALEQWSFEPATLDGKPVTVTYIVTLKFRLQ